MWKQDTLHYNFIFLPRYHYQHTIRAGVWGVRRAASIDWWLAARSNERTNERTNDFSIIAIATCVCLHSLVLCRPCTKNSPFRTSRGKNTSKKYTCALAASSSRYSTGQPSSSSADIILSVPAISTHINTGLLGTLGSNEARALPCPQRVSFVWGSVMKYGVLSWTGKSQKSDLLAIYWQAHKSTATPATVEIRPFAFRLSRFAF